MFSFSGFGTLGLVHSSEPNADFVGNSLQPNGAGFSREWSADVDSRLGVQVTGTFTKHISVVLQVVAEQRYDGTYNPHVEWLNVKYQFTPDFFVRVGRVAIPSFLVSDSRKVGFANPWVRPPVEVYGLVPITANDGVDASYRFHAGDFTSTLNVTTGQIDFTDTGGVVDKARRGIGISDTVEWGALTMHVSYQTADLTVPSLNALLGAFRQFGPAGVSLAEKYEVDARSLSLVAIGALWDQGSWFAMAEWGGTHSHSALGRRSAWYASGGYRLGKVTPYVTYAQTKADSNTSDPGLNASGFPAELAPTIGALNAGLNGVLGSIPVQKSFTLGGRWDFRKDAALKVQYEHIDLGSDSAGTFTSVQPGFQLGGTIHVVSATVDFLF